MKAAISNIAWSLDERLDAYTAMAETGVSGLEVAPSLFFHEAEDPFLPSPRVAKRALAELQTTGLTLVSMQSLLFGTSNTALFGNNEEQANFLIGMKRAITLAGEFGIPNLVFGSPKQRNIPKTMSKQEALYQASELFYGLADIAQNAGTQIAVEANPAKYDTNFLNTLEDVEDFVSRINHPALRCNFDLGELIVNQNLNSTIDRIPDLMPQCNHVHISEPDLAPAPSDPKVLYTVLAALHQSAYDKSVSLEMRRPLDGLVGVKAALKTLSTTLNKVER